MLSLLRRLPALPNLITFTKSAPLPLGANRHHGALLHTTSPSLARPFPTRPKPPHESEIEESFLKGSGPGGQKINKTNSAVQLKHTPTGIVVKSQATRSRDQNRKIAREILAQRIDEHFNGDQSRTAQVASIKRKKAASADKKKRRKYRQLEEENKVAATHDTEPKSPKEDLPEISENPSIDAVDEPKKVP